MFSARGLRVLGPAALLMAALAAHAPGAAAEAEAPAQVVDRYQNPVYAEDFADPFVLRAGRVWFAYSTHQGLANIQILSSPDLVRWQSVGTALPFLPFWAEGPNVWAPTVLARSGHHVLYYAVREVRSGRFCVSAATSDAGPQGPFFDRSSEPLVCQRERGGTIDPSTFTRSDGRAFLLFKSEGIAGREPTRLWSAPLDATGLRLAGRPTELLHTEQPWEEPIIENPAMAYGGGRYFLFYSANRWQTASYATGYAVCDSPLGPCRRPARPRVLSSANGAVGPGGADFFTDTAGDLWIGYHAWSGSRIGYPAGGSRSLRIDRVTFAQGRPWIDGPSTDVRPFSLHPGPPRAVPSHPTPGAPGAPPPTPAAPAGASPPAASATATPPTGAAALPITPGPAVPAIEPADGAEGPAPGPRGDPASRSPSRTGPAALAAVLAASVAAAGARHLPGRFGNPPVLRSRTAPCPSGPGPSPPPGS